MVRILILLTLTLHIGCASQDALDDLSIPVVAAVEEYKLYADELDLLISSSSSPSDSTAMAHAYIENWVRDKLIISEAEKNLKADPGLKNMVEAYRESLVKSEYENVILNEKLDSFISEQEYLQVYDKYKDQFVLDDQIVKFWFAKIPKALHEMNNFYGLWKDNDIDAIDQICQNTKGNCQLNGNIWYRVSTLKLMMPERFVRDDQIRQTSNYRKSDDEFRYYLKYLDFVDKNDLSPIDYIKDELKRVILHGRKEKIIAALTEDLYEKAMKSNRIHVYSNSKE